ncbi:MAG: hypothetical protein JJ913_10370 [Rhizobiaceae bacterium]|nr:hypothetical protein [Rhizobiaceae bacterium]
MRSFLTVPLMVALACAAPARAYTIVPADDGTGRIYVIVERDYGDLVPLSALPPPFNAIVQTQQGPDALSFRWRYFRSDEDGIFYIRVDEDGAGTATFGFNDPEPVQGDRLGVAVVLVDRNGNAMHSMLVRANVEQGADGALRRNHGAELALDREPHWWRDVDALAFLMMKYYEQQAPSDEGVWRAMERAVERFTEGLGTTERVVAK